MYAGCQLDIRTLLSCNHAQLVCTCLQLKLFDMVSDGRCMLVSLQATERVVSACQGERCKGYHPPHGSDHHPGHCLRYPLHSFHDQHADACQMLEHAHCLFNGSLHDARLDWQKE